jgi:hypothetical protein
VRYTLVRPCSECPFLRGTPLNKTISRARLLEFARGEFACHRTADLVEDDDGSSGYVGGPESQHCAGALIALEKVNRPHQMMRIVERLKMYDRRRLDMSARVVRLRADRHGGVR